MLWAYAKLRAGGEFGLFVTGVHDGFLCKACKMYCTKELWYFEGGVREVVLLSMCHIILEF